MTDQVEQPPQPQPPLNPAKARVVPRLGAALNEAEIKRVGQALEEVVGLNGWRLIVELQQNTVAALALQSLRDEDTPRAWYAGAVEGVTNFVNSINQIVQDAREITERQKKRAAVTTGMRFGQGSPAE